MIRGRLLSSLALASMLSSCGEGPDRLDGEGDPCRSIVDRCADDEQLLVCADEVWTARSCEAVCAEQAPGVSSDGCEAVNVEEGQCLCVPPPGGCTPGEAACADGGQIEFCDESWTWTLVGCDSVCAASPINSMSLGCESDEETGAAYCSCTAIGTACSDEAPVCIDENTLASCEVGIWTAMDCSEVCDGAANCEPGVGGAACSCEP